MKLVKKPTANLHHRPASADGGRHTGPLPILAGRDSGDRRMIALQIARIESCCGIELFLVLFLDGRPAFLSPSIEASDSSSPRRKGQRSAIQGIKFLCRLIADSRMDLSFVLLVRVQLHRLAIVRGRWG
jgi:hypothetical protein